jgi:antitoxin PrlF
MSTTATATATVSDKGQVTLPKALRERLGIQPGSRLAFRVATDGSLSVQVLAKGSAGLFGLLAKPGESTRSLEDMEGAITDAVRDRARRTL